MVISFILGLGLSLIFGSILFLLSGLLLLMAIAWLIRQLLGRGPAEVRTASPRVIAPAPVAHSELSDGSGAWRSLWSFAGLLALGTLFGLTAMSMRTTVETRLTSGDDEMSMVPSETGPGGTIIQSSYGDLASGFSREQEPDASTQRGIQPTGEITAAESEIVDVSRSIAEPKVVIPKTPVERRRLLAEFAGQVGRLFGKSEGSQSGTAAPSLGESRNGEVVILELTQPMLRQLLGDSAGDMLRDMQSRLPEDIREGYALIPLGRSLGSAIPPVPPRLAASGLSRLADSLVSVLGGNPNSMQGRGMSSDTGEAASDTGEAASETASGVSSLAAAKRPEWLSNPGVGGRVVRLTRLGTSEQLERERVAILSRAAREILLERGEAEGVSGDYLESLRVVDFGVNERFPMVSAEDRTGSSWVVGRYSEEVEADLGGASGSLPVTVDYYLVRVPESISVHSLPEVVSRVQRVRMAVLFSCGASLWLGMVLLSATGGSSAVGRGRRWLVISGRAAAGVCLLSSLGLGISMISGDLSSPAAVARMILKS